MGFGKAVGRLSAFGMAGALAIGGVVAADAVTAAPASAAEGDRLVGPLVTRSVWADPGMAYTFHWKVQDSLLVYDYSPGDIFTFPAVGTTGPVMSSSGQCLTQANGDGQNLEFASCNTGAKNQEWTLYSNGRMFSLGATWGNKSGQRYGVRNGASDPNSDGIQMSLLGELKAVSVTGPSGFITATRPEIFGTGQPNASITVKDDAGNVLGTTTVGADGKWTLTPSKDLAEGKYAITAEQNANGVKSTATGAFEVKASKPVTVTGPSGTIANNRPLITGTGTPGATVKVFIGGGTIPHEEVVVKADGTWTTTGAGYKGYLAQQDWVARAEQVVDGVKTTDSSAFKVFIATPVAVTGPTGVITDAKPTITGTGHRGATVEVWREGGGLLGTVTVGSDGTWRLPVASELATGPHTVRAEQTIEGQKSSSTGTFEIKTAAKVAVTGPYGTVTDPRPAITGTGEPGAAITVKDGNGTAIGTATVGSDGTWKVTPAKDLANGSYVVTAEQAVNGVKTTATGAFDVNVATKVALTGPTGTTNDPRPAITGTGQPGATVTVTDGAGEVIGTATVGSDGKWSVKPGNDLPEGTVNITAQQNAGGQTSTATGSFEVHIIDELVVTGPQAGSTVDSKTPIVSGTAEPGAEITVTDKDGNVLGTTTADEDGNWSTGIGTLPTGKNEIVVTDNHGGSQNVDFTVPADELVVTGPKPGSTVDSKTPTVEGTGEPGAEITITDKDGEVIGETVVDENGNWSVTLPELGGGSTGITVTDNHGGSTDVDFEVPFEKLVVTGPKAGSTVDSKQPTVSGTAEPGAEITVTDKDGNVLGTTTADTDGNWSTGIGTLPAGKNEIVVTDNHGGTQNVDFTVPTDELVITSPAPEGGAKPTVNSKTPVVSGTAEPGAEITIVDQNGVELCTTTADENGDWACQLPELENGEQQVTVTDNHGGSKDLEFIVSAENGEGPMTAGSLAGLMLAGTAGLGLLIRRRQQTKVDA